MSCPHTEDCPLFPKLTMTLEVWRFSFCDSDERYPSCARYQITLKGKTAPLTLLPNGKDLADAAAKK